jgi:hypothetical protein
MEFGGSRMQSDSSSRTVGESDRRRWLGVAILAGALYLAISMVSATLANRAEAHAMRFIWRLSAFIGCAVVFLVHLGQELRQCHPARITARHTSVGVALGGFALALAANLHDLGSVAGYRPRMLIALVAWPLLTAVPAFVAVVVIGAVFARRPGPRL